MNNRLLLDCTLRDGGYVNDWNFGYDRMINIYERLIESNVDMIELCFIDERRVFDRNRTIFPDTKSISDVFGHINKKGTLVVGMIDYGTCSLENIQECSESYLDGIRVIFKHPNMYDALEYCKKIIDKGYKVFVQATSITSYDEQLFNNLIDCVNSINPHAISIVDTYGLLKPNKLVSILKLFDDKVNKNINIGYHAHNNFQLGYANCMAFLSYETNRILSVDGSLYGMGKSAGNAPTELISMYLNEEFDCDYDIAHMLDAIDNSIFDFTTNSEWGYKLFYFIAAYKACHPSYVSYLIDKGSLSYKSLFDLLDKIEDSKKLFYEKSYIEDIYNLNQLEIIKNHQCLEELYNNLNKVDILILGPGTKIISENSKIAEFLENNNAKIISINYVPSSYRIDYLFVTNSKRYSQLTPKLINGNKFKVIGTSNIMPLNKPFDYNVNYTDLIDCQAKFPDNSLIMALKLLENLSVGSIFLAGFDGYTKSEPTHINKDMQYLDISKHADYLNSYCKNYIKSKDNDLQINFITSSIYE